MSEIQDVEVYVPEWAKGRYLDESLFCQEFLRMVPLVFADGEFFGEDGRVPEDRVRQLVYEFLELYVSTGLSQKTNSLVEVLKMKTRKEELLPSESLVECANGRVNVFTGEFTEAKRCCRHRLPVNYNPNAPEPKRWKSFLQDLLEEEDILTLQEYLGYCLLPVNYAQKMMIIVGKGGEGKSRIGIILHYLLGESMCNGSLAKVEHSPFARADLQHKLIMVDDDLRMEALNATHYLKTLVTAEQEMDLERKGVQSYQASIRCRFLAFGNGNLRALHDRSLGFFRRQIILTTKERPKDRVDDALLAQRLREELEGILLWCLEGLQRLLANELKFTLSTRTRRNILEAISEGDNVTDFMKSRGYFRFDPQGQITSRRLYMLYRDWCEDNILNPLSARNFSTHLMQNQNRYNIRYSYHIDGGEGRHVRGFEGITARKSL